AKSVKQHVTQNTLELMQVTEDGLDNPPAAHRAAIDAKIAAARDEIARYDREKADIKAQAESLGTAADVFKRRGSTFATAVMFLQIAIMMNSVGALLAKRWMWISGLVVGAAGIFYMVQGLL